MRDRALEKDLARRGKELKRRKQVRPADQTKKIWRTGTGLVKGKNRDIKGGKGARNEGQKRGMCIFHLTCCCVSSFTRHLH